MLGACFACKVVHEQYLSTRFVSSVHCQMHTVWMSITYAKEHYTESGKTSENLCLELFPGSRRRHSRAFLLSLLSRALRAILDTYKYL